MLYVARDITGQIRELHESPMGDAQEPLPADNPEALQFIHERWRKNELSDLDRDFIRAIEDTIELLIAKEIILFTDLPPKVQEKLLRRKEIRGRTYGAGSFGSTDSDIIPI